MIIATKKELLRSDLNRYLRINKQKKTKIIDEKMEIKLDTLKEDLQKTKEAFELFGQKTDVIENLQNRVQKLEQAFSK